MTKKSLRDKIIQDLDAGKEYVISGSRVYFLSINRYPVSLPKDYYFDRKRHLQEYFSNREEKDQKRLVLENLSIFATPLPEQHSKPKIEVYPHMLGRGLTLKVTQYDEDDPVWGDCKDFTLKKPTDPRDLLREIDKESWNTAKEREDSRIMDFARKIRDWLRGSN
jgi:hypothetical protein